VPTGFRGQGTGGELVESALELPRRCEADHVQELAYSHEVSSCGFWPGTGADGAFYAYAYPEPAGFAEWPIEPAQAFYDTTLGEFLPP
jgi:hypothetical protein